MGEGKWSGGVANRTWGRFKGARVVAWPGDAERAALLAAELAGERFWCDACGTRHALIEHRQCRASEGNGGHPGTSAASPFAGTREQP